MSDRNYVTRAHGSCELSPYMLAHGIWKTCLWLFFGVSVTWMKVNTEWQWIRIWLMKPTQGSHLHLSFCFWAWSGRMWTGSGNWLWAWGVGGPASLLDSLPGSVTNLLCDLSVPVFSCMRNQIKWGFDTCKCYEALDPPVLCECGEPLSCIHLESWGNQF